jgi:hypothetical protein
LKKENGGQDITATRGRMILNLRMWIRLVLMEALAITIADRDEEWLSVAL